MTRDQLKIGGWMALGSALTVVAAATMQHAQAQRGEGGFGGGQGGGFGGQGGGFGGQGGGQGGFGGPPGGGQGGFPGGPGGPGGMRMGMGGGASVTATDKYVYVLQGNMLYQYATEGLKLTAKVQLPQPQGGPGGPGGPGGGGFPGGGGGGFGGPPPTAEKSTK